MNKYLVCVSVVAFCFCLAGAVTRQELDVLIHRVNSDVRVQENYAVQNASRDAMLTATTQQQRVCIATKLGAAYRDLNLALNAEQLAVQDEYSACTPEQLAEIEAESLAQQLRERYLSKSTAQNTIEQIKQC